jgi:hypothetical protein
VVALGFALLWKNDGGKERERIYLEKIIIIIA